MREEREREFRHFFLFQRIFIKLIPRPIYLKKKQLTTTINNDNTTTTTTNIIIIIIIIITTITIEFATQLK